MSHYRAESSVRECADVKVPSSAVVYTVTQDLVDERQEIFLVLALGSDNRLLARFEVGRGTLTSCPVHPREVFRQLIVLAAARTIFVHNHPSGSPEPSPDDLTLTRRLVRAGKLLGIEVLDHVIVAKDGYVSLAERGVM